MPPKDNIEEPLLEVVKTISLPCTVTGCAYLTMKLDPAVAASVLSSHTLGVHKDPALTRGRRSDRLQKLDRPVLTTGCSQQDFGFYKDKWRRYAHSVDTQNDNLLRDQLLQCAETALRKTGCQPSRWMT